MIVQKLREHPIGVGGEVDRLQFSARIFSGRRRDEFGLTKVRSTQAHSGLYCPELAQLRPQIVPWSTLCRADPVLTTRG
jgi:hypothetical protein